MFGGRVIVPRTIVSAVFKLIALSTVHGYYGGQASKPYKTTEESSWIASSDSWLGRQSCKWLGVCGLTHLNKAGWRVGQTAGQTLSEPDLDSTSRPNELDFLSFWRSGTSDPRTWTNHERKLRHIPQYVLDHAPLIHLYSQEQFWPCDIAEHLIHTTPYLNYTPLQAEADHPTLDDLDGLNEWGRFTYLHSDDNVEDRPKWLGGKRNIPSSPDDSVESTPGWDSRVDGPLPSLHDGSISDWYDAGLGDILENGGSRPNPLPGSRVAPVDGTGGEEMINQRLLGKRLRRSQPRLQNSTAGGRSDAPAVLLTVDKGNGVLDAFWFFFYSYNLGNEVFNIRFGNHVGDWEHTVIRFLNGEPKAVFFSEHNFGEAVAFEAVEKIGQRPVGYSGRGTHAMYGTPGDHPYVLPLGLLHDVTDRGPLWDPLQNVHSFTYDYLNRTLRASDLTPKAPVHWFYFRGHWGDKLYPLNDPRQYRFAGQYHYVNGPLGPMFKNLGRQRICQGNGPCVIKDTLG